LLFLSAASRDRSGNWGWRGRLWPEQDEIADTVSTPLGSMSQANSIPAKAPPTQGLHAMAAKLEQSWTRPLLAWFITLAAIAGITTISIVIVSTAEPEEKPEMARLVFTSALPLFGTWVATILAFYFAKDNLVAANDATIKALTASGTFSKDSRVGDAMTPLASINPLVRVGNKDEAKTLPLKGLYDKMKGTQNSRVPILLLSNGQAVMVVHEPDIDKFAQSKSSKAGDLPAEFTVASLLQIDDLKQSVEAFAAVAESDTVAQARDAMAKKPGAKDVFVTENGKEAGKVLGWLTNSDLSRLP
jgi:hypothetical protein